MKKDEVISSTVVSSAMPQSSLADSLRLESDPDYVRVRDERDHLKEQLDRTKGATDDAKRTAERARKDFEDLEVRYNLLSAIDEIVVTDVPNWTRTPPTDTKWHGIATYMLSDLHFGEVVQPAQVEYSNGFNRAIAYQRLRRWTEKAISIAKDHLGQITYDGACVFLNGDIFSGNIHEELKETNEAPVMAELDFWIDPMVASLRALADTFGKVYVVGRVGNHGRNTRKPVAKNRVEDNFDWLFYRILARALGDDERFSWDLPLSAGKSIQLYDTSFHATHGDSGINGGKGISGILHPVTLADFRARKAYSQMDKTLDDGGERTYDWMVLGHFHTYLTLSGVIVNGSMKGYDEYALQNKFGFEVPQQAFWVTTPEHGPSFHVGIEMMDREAEGW